MAKKIAKLQEEMKKIISEVGVDLKWKESFKRFKDDLVKEAKEIEKEDDLKTYDERLLSWDLKEETSSLRDWFSSFNFFKSSSFSFSFASS